jgi:hypothetical protein
LILERVQTLISSSGVKQHSSNRLQQFIIGDNISNLQKAIDAYIDDVEIDELSKDIAIVPNVQQDL